MPIVNKSTGKTGRLFDVECQYDPRMDGRYKCTNISFQGDTRSSEWFMVVKGTNAQKRRCGGFKMNKRNWPYFFGQGLPN